MRSPSVRDYPFYGYINAGWPSPAEEELIDKISFDDWLIQDNSFMITVTHDAMQDAGIHHGDIVVIQRGRTPYLGDIVIAELDGKWVLRYYQKEHGEILLYPANGRYLVLHPEESLRIIGVVTACIRKYY